MRSLYLDFIQHAEFVVCSVHTNIDLGWHTKSGTFVGKKLNGGSLVILRNASTNKKSARRQLNR